MNLASHNKKYNKTYRIKIIYQLLIPYQNKIQHFLKENNKIHIAYHPQCTTQLKTFKAQKAISKCDP